MTKPAVATQAQIERAIRAAMRSGLRVTAIRSDGTVIVESDLPDTKPTEDDDNKWMDD
jgi:hypothetical protein